MHPSPARSLPRETFTWTNAVPLTRAEQVEREAEQLSETIARACNELFPRLAGYRIHEDRLCGAIRGRRYRISRRGFVGQVSVQLFATAGAYRREDSEPLRLRVAGHYRVAPPPRKLPFPTEALTLGALVLLLSIGGLVLGGRGWWAVAQNPSLSWFIDGLGFLAAAMMVVLAGTAATVMIREGRELPWVRLRSWLHWPTDHSADRRRWSELCERLESPAQVEISG